MIIKFCSTLSSVLYMRIRRIYYKFRWIGLIRHFLSYFYSYSVHIYKGYRGRNTIKVLRQLIDSARKKNQSIFVQFPVIAWYTPLYQRPQQLARAMANIGYLTIYLLPVTSSKLCVLEKVSDNLFLTDQLLILEQLSGVAISIYLNYSAGYLDRYINENFFKKNIVFYEYVDSIDPHIWGTSLVRLLKNRIEAIENQSVKFVLATSKLLCQELTLFCPNKQVVYLPNGVDVCHYSINKSPETAFNLPNSIQQAIKEKRNIIGYFGAIAPWIWDELIIELSKQRPQYFILMIGPFYGEKYSFPKRENIYMTGTIQYENLPFYVRHFDVSIIPFRLGELAKSTSPLKLFEYFAIGKPIVVTSDLIECTQFEGVASASNAKEFIIAVDKALEKKNDQALYKQYQQYAHDNTWTIRAKMLAHLIEGQKDLCT